MDATAANVKNEIDALQEWIDAAHNIVFFGGAGVSTESGIPDFRSTDGLYFQQYDYPPETILSHSFYESRPDEFFRFYRSKLLNLDALPNRAHEKLAQLERSGKLKAVVTQNIDGLHQKAGSRVVHELHGSVERNYCEKCHASYDAKFILQSDGIPTCTACGARIKPDVVLYEEPLDSGVVERAVAAIRAADLLIAGGTSFAVYPAAGFVQYFAGDRVVLINKDPTPGDRMAKLLIRGKIGEIMSQIRS